MRIIAGELGGRVFDSPRSSRTHPMSERLRGAVFNVLGDIDDLRILDAFAGSGALALEAISRGASSAVLLESDIPAQRVIAKNIDNLGLAGRIRLIRAGAAGWSENNRDARFDIVFCDPPYNKPQLAALRKLSGHVSSGGVLVLSWPGKVAPPRLAGLDIVKLREFGDAQLVFYKPKV